LSMRSDHTVHDLKIRINEEVGSREEWLRDLNVVANRIEIWRCKTLKLFAKDPFYLIKKPLRDFKFSNDEDSDAQRLGAAQKVAELELEDSEILLARVPQQGPDRDER